MTVRDMANVLDDRATLFPSHWDGNEMLWGGQFHVYVQTLLERRDCSQHRVRLWPHDEVDVDRCVPPSDEHSRRTSNEEHLGIACRFVGEGREKCLDALARRERRRSRCSG